MTAAGGPLDIDLDKIRGTRIGMDSDACRASKLGIPPRPSPHAAEQRRALAAMPTLPFPASPSSPVAVDPTDGRPAVQAAGGRFAGPQHSVGRLVRLVLRPAVAAAVVPG